jgi:outer membrane murein-binding lipoprotein Lpp
MEDRSGSVTGKKSRLYHYRDASGKVISSLVPLSCPAYIGDVNGAVGEAKQRIRNVTGRVGTVESKVESMDARVARLEAENEALKAQVSANRMEVVEFVQWLGQMVAEHAQKGLPSVRVEVQGQNYQLPQPVARVITSIGALPREDYIEAEVVSVVPLERSEKIPR